MKIKFLVMIFLLLNLRQRVLSQEQQVRSPDGKTYMHIFTKDGELSYSISFNRKEIISASPLGLEVNGYNSGTNVNVKSADKDFHSERISWPIGENSIIDNTYNELILGCESGPYTYNLKVRVFNGSVAFKYVFPTQNGLEKATINKENTAFTISDPALIYQYHHESVFTPTKVDTLNKTCDFPATLRSPNFYLSIGEADNRNYTKAELAKGSGSNSLSVAFVRDKEVTFDTGFETPWRTVSISKTAIGLHQFSELFLKLTPPSPNTDLSKIVPGKLIRAQLNTQSGLDCIDLAKKMNFKYIMFDGSWYGPDRAVSSDPTVPIPAIDMPKVLEYARQNDIKLILYLDYVGLRLYLDKALPVYKQWGVAGLKFGFVDGFSQKGLTWLDNAIKKVNDNGFLLNIHDNYKPTGLSRAYPYLLTQEGIRGDENSPDAFHTTTLPYTRFLAGAADFTFCFPNPANSYSKNIKVSKAQQLALTVVYFSPLQAIFWYGRPKDYTNFDEIEFFKYVPTVWDETRYLAGEIGENISVARRKGTTWFIGNAAGLNAWKTNLKLDFLDKGKSYKATFYEDGSSGQIVKRVSRLKRGYKLMIDLKTKGGQAIMIEREE